jgi:hypothetical protein
MATAAGGASRLVLNITMQASLYWRGRRAILLLEGRHLLLVGGRKLAQLGVRVEHNRLQRAAD